MARTRGAKSSSPSNRKKSLRKEPSQVLLQSLRRQGQSSSGEPAPPKPPARRYLTRSGGRPLQKKPRVESSKPIDLTEQSPEPSPITSPVQTPVPSPIPSPSPLPVPSPVPSPAPQEKSQEPPAPLPEPQIQAEQLWKNIQSEAGACPIIPTAEEVSYGASVSSKRFFLPPDSHRFYQSMTPKRAWTNPTELEMVRTLSRGAANRSHLLRGELPPVMFLIHAFLRHNIYPCSIGPKEGESPGALYKMSEGFFFGPHHLIMAALLYLKRRFTKRSFREQIAFPSSS
ncbi:hypothetical protein CK203_046732 [Vitis vinifera]|uniref:Uncharacterized protein n=1 Tax=Vitis vinifera TaxID=29760 RepID=A0A438H2B9_VITVI|nr:hypothetical protein CK203_046732 [Vitis vinifera]